MAYPLLFQPVGRTLGDPEGDNLLNSPRPSIEEGERFPLLILIDVKISPLLYARIPERRPGLRRW
jgi:hypothetical protein